MKPSLARIATFITPGAVRLGISHLFGRDAPANPTPPAPQPKPAADRGRITGNPRLVKSGNRRPPPPSSTESKYEPRTVTPARAKPAPRHDFSHLAPGAAASINLSPHQFAHLKPWSALYEDDPDALAPETDREFIARLTRAPRVPSPPANSTAAAILRAGEKARSPTGTNESAPRGIIAEIINAGRWRRGEVP
jgi:hypothetical protein